MRRLSAEIDPSATMHVHRVVDMDGLVANWSPDLRFLVVSHDDEEKTAVLRLRSSGLRNVFWIACQELDRGDVVVPDPLHGKVMVLYRETDTHHALLLTNRCNSYCLMCSQPPSKADDSWLIEEALDVIRHLPSSPAVLGLSGGEPLLLGAGLRRILDSLHERHPTTLIEVLTNGRLFGDEDTVRAILHDLRARVHWLVPLYGHADFLHDFVVQSHGAYEQTLAGLLNLQANRQSVQLRVVLIEPVLRELQELSSFIGRNLPFVQEVALMACEPIGFALANRSLCEVDLAEWGETLESASRMLNRHGVPHLFMNAPLCALPPGLWRLAHRSISDWKNTYVEECDRCAVRDQCSGLFAWHESGWKPTTIRAIEELSI